ncbi:acetate kinase [Desulfobulbus propionicus DSM 2032]|jgi:acetate kinase|uniref:Acetate kinase n=1 Tax=Desulfobulbus propionicus (strain ATCC 33891 / DSM 2032 / VKM B-1956 / 1pr3) TaxID=577650 RepID=A0A7U3YJI9_DESPD|nr:acetate kinase [Desulfobulbus propionicus]ADW16562.1 acetate kinase [Desulfobulbus propionicus DSM 2032]
MKFFIINSGSSSIKYQVIEMKTETVLATGLVERIGEETGRLKNTFLPGTATQRETVLEQQIADHYSGMMLVISLLTDKAHGIIKDTSEISAIGHRVVHGGEDFRESTRITPKVIEALQRNIPLAPLHNPANLDGIRVAMDIFPTVFQVAVFDTAFHQTMPPRAFMYALPYQLYEQDRVRRYGFHGTSHRFVAGECARLLAKPLDECNLITVHLGNGCSMTAIENGRSIDTSLGMTPLEGLVMGTRCGDLDPAIHLFLKQNKGMDLEAIDAMLNKESGLKGLCGMNDMRDIHQAVASGDARATLALEVQTYRNRKYIGAYMAVLGRVDGIVFTAGIGENDDIVRAESLKGLEVFGVHLDPEKNRLRSKEARRISREDSSVRVFVIPTNEELAIAREVANVLRG